MLDVGEVTFLIANIFQNDESPRLPLHQFVCFVVANVHQPVVVKSAVGWWSPSVDVRVVVLLRPRVFVNKLPSSQGPGQRLDGAEHVVVDSPFRDNLRGVTSCSLRRAMKLPRRRGFADILLVKS